MRKTLAALAVGLGFAPAPALPQSTGPAAPQVTALILRESRTVKEPDAWADDMLAALQENDLPATRENICAGIAVIGQESGFVANPQVPGLGKLALAALHRKLDGMPIVGARILAWLDAHPEPGPSYLSRISNARTERDLDLTYRDLVAKAAGAADLGGLLNTGLFNRYVEAENNITTAGSMQVSVAFALKTANARRWFPMSLDEAYAVRDALYSRGGGMSYGLRQLLGYDSGYTQKIFRFADYNAGRYASRNAAFQQALAQLSQTDIALDGDLLAYDGNGSAKSAPSLSERLLREVIRVRALGLSDKALRADLLREKEADFTTTATYTKLRAVYRDVFGKDAPTAILPRITLSSIKIKHRMTTADYANRVNTRYQRCMRAP